MFTRRTVATILAVCILISGVGFAQSLEENWNDFLHYIKIGRLDMANGYAETILASEPNAVDVLALSEKNPSGYSILQRVVDSSTDTKLVEQSNKIMGLIEQGKFIRRTDPKVITEEIRRLSSTPRAKQAAVSRLKNAGEYAIPYMLDAMADPERKAEMADIIWALGQIGRDAIRPLAAAMQTENVGVKAEIIKAMGNIGYAQSLPYLKYVLEKDKSGELRGLADESMMKIDPAASKLSAAELFYNLGGHYYYHAESLAPVEDANFSLMWFWDPNGQRLVREKVDRDYFYELMSMRCCEWSLKSDAEYGKSIGLWLAAYFKAESTGSKMPNYFGQGHAEAMTYATTAGAEYLHQALARAIDDKNSYVALHVIEALASTAGEKSLFYRLGMNQPLVDAMSFNNREVRYSAAIAIAEAGPSEMFPQTQLVAKILGEALEQVKPAEGDSQWNDQKGYSYAVRAAKAMLKTAKARNNLINLSAVEGTIIKATEDPSKEIQVLACQILANMNSAGSQKAITAMALRENGDNELKITAFESLAVSAKSYGNLLDEKLIDAIYSLVQSKSGDVKLRSAAAAAYGALDLPSRKVKDLILDQASS